MMMIVNANMSSYIYIYIYIINYICCYKHTIIKKCNQCAIFYSFATNLTVSPTTKVFLCIFVALKVSLTSFCCPPQRKNQDTLALRLEG